MASFTPLFNPAQDGNFLHNATSASAGISCLWRHNPALRWRLRKLNQQIVAKSISRVTNPAVVTKSR
jgi:hypothetical protein